MTARRNFKRIVRARASRTGESYTSALQHFLPAPSGGTMPAHQLRRVAKPELGFAVSIFDDWTEQPTDRAASPGQLVRFANADGSTNLVVFSLTQTPLSPAAAAEAAAGGLAEAGYRDFVITEVQVADRAGARLDCRRPTDTGAMTQRRYIVNRAPRYLFDFAIASADEDSASVFDAIGSRIEIIKASPPSDTNPVEAFTLRARRVLHLARQQAAANDQDWVGIEHLLAGLVLEGEGVAYHVLNDLGIEAHSVVELAARQPAPPVGARTGPNEWTHPAAEVLKSQTIQEALGMGHAYIGTEHLLLAMFPKSGAGPAEALVRPLGLEGTIIRARVLAVLSGDPPG